ADVVGADGEEDEIEAAAGALLLDGGEHVLQLRDLALHAARAIAGERAIAGALAAKEAGLDGSAGAGEWHGRHRGLRVVGRERERGAELIAVEGAMAGRRRPAGARARPRGGGVAAGAARRVVAGLQALEAGAARTEVFARAAAEEAAEAIAVVGQRDGAIGI